MKNAFTHKHEYSSFIRSALTLNGSVTPRVARKVIVIFLYACLISYAHYLVPSIVIPIGPFEYAGLMMGLILVFRINSGYDRWWEARKIWGNLVNCTRNLAIIIVAYTGHKNNERVEKLINYLSITPFLIMTSLRKEAPTNELKALFDKDTYEKVFNSNNPPLTMCALIAQELNMAKNNNELDPFSFLQAEEQRGYIIDCLGACERILNTPIPFVMAIKSRRFILIFLLALPLALVNVSIFFTPLITSLVAYAIFSLDQIGVELQNPFSTNSLSHLPLDEICSKIKSNITEISVY